MELAEQTASHKGLAPLVNSQHAQLGHFSVKRTGSITGYTQLHRDCPACMLGGSQRKTKRHANPADNRNRGGDHKQFGERVSSDIVTGFPACLRYRCRDFSGDICLKKN